MEPINSQRYDEVTKLANFYGKWPGNYLRDLGYVPSIELQKQLLSQVLNTTDLDSALLEFGWIKQEIPLEVEVTKAPLKRVGKKKVEKIEEVGEDLVWNT